MKELYAFIIEAHPLCTLVLSLHEGACFAHLMKAEFATMHCVKSLYEDEFESTVTVDLSEMIKKATTTNFKIMLDNRRIS
jgi:hypothetical protein